MPYIDTMNAELTDPQTYDVLVRNPDGTERLLVGRPEVGGLLGSAEAAIEADGQGATLIDAWYHGGRVWSDVPGPEFEGDAAPPKPVEDELDAPQSAEEASNG